MSEAKFLKEDGCPTQNRDAEDYEYSHCECLREHVCCDENCGAFMEPITEEETGEAYQHWRYHQYLAGCSHAR